MPLYEYRCTQCGNLFERIESYSAPEVTECPVCKGAAERMFSAPAVQFKGSGFYSTDYPAKRAGVTAGKATENGGASISASADGSGSGSKDGAGSSGNGSSGGGTSGGESSVSSSSDNSSSANAKPAASSTGGSSSSTPSSNK